jgi:hypothetical protein
LVPAVAGMLAESSPWARRANSGTALSSQRVPSVEFSSC